jgi:hypothetical protein
LLDLVRRLTDPYTNSLDAVPPASPAVCPTCRSTRDPRYDRCRACTEARVQLGPNTADLVVPIALAVKGQQLANELWQYKSSPAAEVRRQIQQRMTALLSRFLETRAVRHH